MRSVHSFGLLALALVGIASHAEQLPPVTSETLTGAKVELPCAVAGKVAVLCIGFTHASSGQVTEWTTTLRRNLKNSPGVNIYFVAVLQGAPRFVRGMIVRAMKHDVPPADHNKSLLVFSDEAVLRQVVGFDAPEDAYVVILDPAGTVRYTLHGRATDSAVHQVSARVLSLASASSASK